MSKLVQDNELTAPLWASKNVPRRSPRIEEQTEKQKRPHSSDGRLDCDVEDWVLEESVNFSETASRVEHEQSDTRSNRGISESGLAEDRVVREHSDPEDQLGGSYYRGTKTTSRDLLTNDAKGLTVPISTPELPEDPPQRFSLYAQDSGEFAQYASASDRATVIHISF